MVASMTAFARNETDDWIWEVRSVNHRYLDISLNLPTVVQILEPELHKVAKTKLSRGRIEGTLITNKLDTGKTATLNKSELRSLYANVSAALAAMNEQGGQSFAQQSKQIDILEIFWCQQPLFYQKVEVYQVCISCNCRERLVRRISVACGC